MNPSNSNFRISTAALLLLATGSVAACSGSVDAQTEASQQDQTARALGSVTTKDSLAPIITNGLPGNAIQDRVAIQGENLDLRTDPSVPGPSFLETVGATTPRSVGHYHYSFGFFDGVDAEVKEGESTVVDFGSLANRRSAKIFALPAAKKLFPDDLSSPCQLRDGESFGVQALVGNPRLQPAWRGVPDGGAMILGEYGPAPDTFHSHTYILCSPSSACYQNPGTRDTLQLSANPGDAPVEVHIGRIDVDDVSVTRDDGTTVKVPGQYSVERLYDGRFHDTQCGLGANAQRGGTSPTRTGLNVLPGTYRVTTSYAGPDGPSTTVKNVIIPQ